MNNTQLVNELLEEGYNMTDNPFEAIYILTDGQLISGDFDCGCRGTDHRMIECVIDGDRYEDDFWDKVHTDLGLVRVVPETEIALIKEGQELTAKQEEIISQIGFEIEAY
ncbi:hypothetical protein ACYSTM_21105 [Bacillus licheniformis]|uniref:hypothetical protein n=1 Tax=Bacillus licheniformis TaxID=1402 RepID=UPI0011AA7B64|nr:hypothetical protein [Bacillus licheniformis]